MLDAINTNIISLSTQNNLARSQSSLSTSIQRLSSGLKINSAMDDPAGLAIASRMTAQVGGLNQATQNANNGVSMLQTADGGLASTTSLLQSMRSLAVEAANGTNSSTDLASLQTQMSQLQQQIGTISSQTQYNGINLLDGSLNNVQFQVGANANQTISFGVASAAGTALGNNNVDTAVTKADTSIIGSANGAVAGTLTVSGTSSSAISTTLAETAQQVAASVNAVSNTTGVTATASNTATLSAFASAGTYSFSINGTAVTAALGSATDVAGLTSAINNVSAQTGVTAVANTNTGQITLSNQTGADIKLVNNSVAANTVNFGGAGNSTGISVAGGASATTGGQVSFNSNNSFAVTDSSGSFAATAVTGSTLNAVSAISLTSVTNGIPTGANSALVTIDAAIQSINTSRANVGALENRFTSVVSNLQTSTLNITSSLSTVQDTNFASETASLSRGQILQQAGTAMLAQANSLPNGVLALLR